MVWGFFSFPLLLTSQNTYCLHLWFIVYFPTIPRKLTPGKNLAKVRAEVASWTGRLLSLHCILGNQNETKGSQQFFQLLLQQMHSVSLWYSHQPSPPYNFMSSEVKPSVWYLKHTNVRTWCSQLPFLKLSEVLPHAYLWWRLQLKGSSEKKRNWFKVDFRVYTTK